MHLLLPGPPLAEWLLASFADMKMALWTGPDAGRGRGGRAARATTTALRERLGWIELAEASAQERLDGLVVVAALGGSEPPAGALARVRAGGWLVELAHPPPVPLWRPSRWAARGELVRRASASRAGLWLGRGCFAVEQWAPIDAPRVLVTCGKVRAIPGP